MSMTENEAIEDLKQYDNCAGLMVNIKHETCVMAIQALEEIQKYREYEQRLKNVYGECEGILDVIIRGLERHENLDLPCIEVKSVILIDEDVDKWGEYRAIGTVEEFNALKEKSELKIPDYQGDGCWDGHVVIDTWICPNCGKHYEVDYDNYDYCPNCGQHIDHSTLTEDD